MITRRALFCVFWMLACGGLLPVACFAQWNADIPQFAPPVQNYAAIDISGSVQGSNSVRAIALDDTNTAAFVFSSATGTQPPGQAGQVYHVPDANAEAYTWSNGTLSADMYTDLTVRTDVPDGPDSSYNYNTFFAYIGGVDISGTVFGAMYNMRVSTDGAGTDLGQIACLFSTDGGKCSPITLPTPFTSADDSGSSGGPMDISSQGVVIGLPNAREYGWPLCDGDLPYIDGGGHFTVFVGGTNFNGVTIDPGLAVEPYVFYPYIVNNNGAALGSLVTNGSSTTELWTEEASLVAIAADKPCSLNDQDQAGLITKTTSDAPGEGYLWENGTQTTLRYQLPFWFEWQDWNIAPNFLSNQVHPTTPASGASGSTTDTTIHILASASGFDVGAYGETLWTRDNNGKWTFANVALPSGTTITNWTSINSSGVIAAIGNCGTGDDHALLLVPVTFTVKNCEWTINTPVVKNHPYSPANNPVFQVARPADASKSTADFQGTVGINVAGIDDSHADTIAQQWQIGIHQDLIAGTGAFAQYTTSTVNDVGMPVPGWDNRAADDAIPFAANNDVEIAQLTDSPGLNTTGIARYLIGIVGTIQTPTGPVNRIGPIFSQQLKTVTFNVAGNLVTGQSVYLRWVRWHVLYEVNFDFTQQQPWNVVQLQATIDAQGEGQGSLTPSTTPITIKSLITQ